MSFVPPLDPALAALFNSVEGIPGLSDVVRRRAIIRARALVQARVAWAGDAPVAAASKDPRPPRWRGGVSFMAALLLGSGIGGGGAVALDLARVRPQGALAPVSDPPLGASPRVARAEVLVLQPSATPGGTAPRLRPPGRALVARESYAAEIELLERVQAAIARRNSGAALALLAEHARRFPRGRLAEEREALKVRLLAGAGHANDARRAEIAFADQFPRSVLLPRVQVPPAAR